MLQYANLSDFHLTSNVHFLIGLNPIWVAPMYLSINLADPVEITIILLKWYHLFYVVK